MIRLKKVVVGAAVAMAVFVPAEQASAHAGLEASVPSANAILETGPPNIELDFNEAVDFKLADIELYDQTAKLIATGPPQRITDDTVVQVSVPSISNGVYVVVWRVPSADGHVVDGVFSFQLGVHSGFDIGALIDKVSGNSAANSTVGRLDTSGQAVGPDRLDRADRWGRAGGAIRRLGVQQDVAVVGVGLPVGWFARIVRPVRRQGRRWHTFRRDQSVGLGESGWLHTASVLLVRAVLVLVVGVLLLTFARRASEIWRVACGDTRHRVGHHVFERRPRQRPASRRSCG